MTALTCGILRSTIDEQRGRKKKEREANRKRLSPLESKLRVAGGEVAKGCLRWVMGMKEGTCDQHWVLHVLYVNEDPLNSTPEMNITLDAN